MKVLDKSSQYRLFASVSLIAIISGIFIAVYYQYPDLQAWLYKNIGGNQLPAIALTTSVPEVKQPNISSDDKDSSPKSVTDIFAVRTWEPPVQILPPAPLAPPDAPLLPFKFIGRIAEPQKGTAFLLTHGKDLVQVSVGDSVDGVYRVDKYENGQLYFLYQPLNIRQSIFVGSDQ